MGFNSAFKVLKMVNFHKSKRIIYTLCGTSSLLCKTWFTQTLKKRGKVRINVIFKRVRSTIFAVVKQYVYIFRVCVCSLIYPTLKVHALYYNVIYGLSGCTVFFHILSYKTRYSENHFCLQNVCFDFLYDFFVKYL